MLNSIVSVLDSGGAGGGGGAYESIATATGTGSSGTITFSSIPSTYKHLQIRGIGRTTTAALNWDDMLIRFNSDSGSNYSWHYIEGTGTSANAGGGATQTYGIAVNALPRNNNTAGIMGVALIDVHDYGSTTNYKTLRMINGGDSNGGGGIYLASASWRSTSAVTSISLVANGTNFGTTTSFALYGIKGA